MQRTIVLKGHTLGVVMPFFDGTMLQIQILHTSVLRGSPISGDPLSAMGTMMFNPETDEFREATEQDFNDFRVMSHPDYFKEFVDERQTPACLV